MQKAARPPAALEIAIAALSRAFPLLHPIHRAALEELLRCVSASEPSRPFRISVASLMLKLSRSRNTVSRYLAALVSAGLLERWQPLAGSRRWGFRCSWMRLSTGALEALGLQRAPSAVPVSNQVSPGNRWTRVRRIPQDLAALAGRIGAERVVWLMARCRAAGRRLQEFAAQALAADSPAGYVLHALRAPQSPPKLPQNSPNATCGDSRQDARAYLDAQQKAGARTEAARLAGLEMLRAVRGQGAQNQRRP
jgi:hypothetical protein